MGTDFLISLWRILGAGSRFISLITLRSIIYGNPKKSNSHGHFMTWHWLCTRLLHIVTVTNFWHPSHLVSGELEATRSDPSAWRWGQSWWDSTSTWPLSCSGTSLLSPGRLTGWASPADAKGHIQRGREADRKLGKRALPSPAASQGTHNIPRHNSHGSLPWDQTASKRIYPSLVINFLAITYMSP